MRSFSQWSMDRPDKLRQYEEKIHPRFVSKYAGEPLCFEDIYQLLLAQSPRGWSLKQGDILLDLGCGTGWYARRLSTDCRCTGTSILGIDLSQNALEVACAKQSEVSAFAQVTYQRGNLLKGLPECSAREIWFCGAWHQAGDVECALSNISSVLGDDGLVHIQTYCVDPENRQPIDTAIMRVAGHHVFHEGEIEVLAKRCGLSINGFEQKGMVGMCTMSHLG